MVNVNIIQQYLESGKKLFPLKKESKVPSFSGWRNKNYTLKQLIDHDGNLAWAISNDYLLIDVDPLNGGDVSFKRLHTYISNMIGSWDISPCVITPSGGHHYYLKLPQSNNNLDMRKTLKEYQGIDFLREGTYCLIAGNFVNTNNRHGFYKFYDVFEELLEYPAPQPLLDLLTYNKSTSFIGDFEGLIGGKCANWSLVKIKRMLSKLDPDMDYDSWVKVGMALHCWNPLDGLDVWREWSSLGKKYDENVLNSKWKSFNVGGGISLGTVNRMAKEVEFDEVQEKVLAYIERIKFADERALHFDIIPKIRDEDFDKLKKERLIKVMQDRFKEINGVKISVQHVRQLLQKQDETGKFKEEETPDWCKDWLYVNSHNGFMHVPTMKLHKSESFNIENGIFIPLGDGNTKPSATKYVADRGFIRKVDAIGYLPTYNGLICSIDGSTILNTFNKKTVPVASKKFSKGGLNAIKLMQNHIKMLCGQDDYLYNMMLQWIAHQVQYPGKLILWMFLIVSIQGVGKSYIGHLLRQVLGDVNVGTVSPSQIVSNFNSWASGVLVNILEEIKITGHSRYDAMNSLKPLITDPKIMINEKGIKQLVVNNTTNMIGFSNFKDAVPIELDDRRICPIFVNVETLSDVENVIGIPINEYYPQLFGSAEEYSSELRKYFEDFEISEEFMKTKRAPSSPYKKMMIATEEESHTGFVELRNMIEQGGMWFCKEVISSVDLFDEFSLMYPEIYLDNRRKSFLLKKLGYSVLPQPAKIDGRTRKLWTKTPMEVSQAKRILEDIENSLQDSSNDKTFM